jgi:uncharacterized protein (TIGR00255 family)
MMRSMTGFGTIQVTIDGAPCTIEARSVNGRYLECSVKLPKDWQEYESAIRERVRQRISRGSVTVYIRRDDTLKGTFVGFDAANITQYLHVLEQARTHFSLPGEIEISNLIHLPGVFAPPVVEANNADIWAELEEGIDAVCSALNAARETEGAALNADLQQRLQTIATILDSIEVLSAERIPLERERLRAKVQSLMGDNAVDEQRLMLEIVLLSEKLDVAEEAVRLRSHISFFRTTAAADEPGGRKLNFLMQEMNREINTIGSKSNHAAIAHLVVEAKEELERMREQVQNIE